MQDARTLEPGCYVDDSWGQYGEARAYQVLRGWGWTPDDAATLDGIADDALVGGVVGDGVAGGPPVWRQDRADAVGEAQYGQPWGAVMQDAVDAGCDALADRVPDGHYLGWTEGMFGVWPITSYYA